MGLDFKVPRGGFSALGSGLLLLAAADAVTAGAPGNSPSRAQSMGKDLMERRGLDQPLPPAKEEPKLEVPDTAPRRPAEDNLSGRLKLRVNKIKLLGNTRFPEADLAAVTAPYENREITTVELQALRQELTRYYVDRGYINSGAVIPDQDARDGNIEIRIIEGQLERIDLRGNEGLRDGYLRDRIELGAGSPLNVGQLQERLQMLLESPLIERIQSDLRPGSAPGLAVLKTLVSERSPYQLGAIFDNQIAPSIGGYQGTVFAGHRNLTGNGDALSAQGRFAEGMTGYGVDYWLPLNRYDTTAHGWYSRYDSQLVEDPFNIIDVTSRSQSYGISVSHPVIHTPGNLLLASISLERRISKTYLGGQRYSFSDGVDDGKSVATVLRIGQDWTWRSTEQVLAVRSSFNVGLDLFDATINRGLPDGRFFSWLGQAQWARRLGDSQLIWRADLQVADDGLLPLEKFQIGGFGSVRGYRENQIVRDWGFSSSLEYRYPLLTDWLGPDKLFVAPFVDVGGAWNVDAKTTQKPEILVSVGLGVIWEPDRRIHTHLYWGQPLVNVDNPREDPQDYGFHFKVSGQFF